MQIEVLSNNPNAANFILFGLKRRVNKLDEVTPEICEEVAEELKFELELKENGNILFKDN